MKDYKSISQLYCKTLEMAGRGGSGGGAATSLTSFKLMEACRIRDYVRKLNTDREPFAAAAFM